MSFKTDRLIALFPDAYAVGDRESLLYKLLDSLGAELMDADAAIKQLLKSHWVNYAEGAGLDALGAIYGITRRQLRSGGMETDPAFRLRLKSTVEQYTRGGTLRAVKGAVQSALGLPFDLQQLNLPDQYKPLLQELENLVRIEEFSPTIDRLISDRPTEVNSVSEVILVIEAESVQEITPEIRWTFIQEGSGKGSSGRLLSLERLGSAEGIKATEDVVIPPGAELVLSSEADGSLSALLQGRNIANLFVNLDGSTPARLPLVPRDRSEWRFRAQSALFDLSTFDNDESFDLPDFEVEFRWVRYQPLTFEVYVPYFLQEAVQVLKERYQYPGELFVFEGLPREQIQTVINQTKAAGVRGSVQFSLNFFETQDQTESFRIAGIHRAKENANATDSLEVGSFNREIESHDLTEEFIIGGVFDISTFDTNYGFQ